MARSLVVNNIQKQLKLIEDTEDSLPPGTLHLYNYYLPSLTAGLYSIEATQHIDGPTGIDGKPQSADIFNKKSAQDSTLLKQEFNVVAPQFSLDPSLINSHYPPDGHEDEGNILPHIVFSDPHVPWYRFAGTQPWMIGPTDTGDSDGHPELDKQRGNCVPWLALLVFKADDLRVSSDEASALGLDKIKVGKQASSTSPASTTPPAAANVYDAAKQPATGAFPMTVGDYLKIITSRVDYEKGYEENPDDLDLLKKSDEGTSIIFPLKTDVQNIFDPDKKNLTGLQAQKLLAHVRHLNTIGFPDAGVEGFGYYSVVVSSMTGDLTTTSPTTHIVHLVSIEHLDSTLGDAKFSLVSKDNPDRIGMVSLFSWTYHCIPEAVNFEVMMQNLGSQAQPLRPPKESLKLLADKSTGNSDARSQSAARLLGRLNAGYTVARWRAASGEASMAFNRGPLVPVRAPDVPSTDAAVSKLVWPALSMSGRDYAIFDKSLGMLDATYASAWSLGKLVSISDTVFNAALMRFRSSIWNTSTSNLRKTANGVDDWTKILNDSVNAMKNGQDLASGGFTGTVSRVNKPADTPLAPPVNHPTMAEGLLTEISASINKCASTPKGALYDGFSKDSAATSDWEIIYNWIYDCLYLGHIPAHALFPDPSHLKSFQQSEVPAGSSRLYPEALRFFYIDNAWLDCFIDGALSCANHVEPQYDNIRLKVKQVFNAVLNTEIGTLKKKPPVPRYGFIMRSAAIRATPDIKLTVRRWTLASRTNAKGEKLGPDWIIDPDYDPLVRHTKMDDYTILSLVDCLPEEIAYIEFAQPAHQQRFAFGVNPIIDDKTHLVTRLDPNIDVIRLFTYANKAPPNTEKGVPFDPSGPSPPDMEWKILTTLKDRVGFYNVDTRCINPINIAKKMVDTVIEWGKIDGCFDQSRETTDKSGVATASIFGIEMNDRAYHFKIPGSAPKDKSPFPTWTRQLWTGYTADPQTTTAKPSTETTNPPAAVHQQVAISNPSTTAAILSDPVRLNTTATIRLDTSPIPPPSTFKPNVIRTLENPWAGSPDAQFEMLIHPDYRPAPLKPVPPQQGSRPIFSPQDYLATDTTYLWDLMFSIRRVNKGDTKRNLRSLTIEIPVSRGTPQDDKSVARPGARDIAREPLLQSIESSHSGVRMAYNQRFVPSLFNGPSSIIGDVRWDNLPVLGITLIPRSGRTSGTVYLGKDDHAIAATNAVTVRLGQVQLNPVVTKEPVMAYSQPPAKPGGKWTPKLVPDATLCHVKLTETYADGLAPAYSFCSVVKVPGKDKGFPDM